MKSRRRFPPPPRGPSVVSLPREIINRMSHRCCHPRFFSFPCTERGKLSPLGPCPLISLGAGTSPRGQRFAAGVPPISERRLLRRRRDFSVLTELARETSPRPVKRAIDCSPADRHAADVSATMNRAKRIERNENPILKLDFTISVIKGGSDRKLLLLQQRRRRRQAVGGTGGETTFKCVPCTFICH